MDLESEPPVLQPVNALHRRIAGGVIANGIAGGGNIIVDGAYLNLALMHIRSMGIEAELVNGKEETEK